MRKTSYAACWVLLVLAAFLGGCRPRILEPPIVRPMEAQTAFSRAESLFERQDYPRALEAYQDYLARFPRDSMAPAAWIRIADIFAARGDHPEARKAVRHILQEHPRSGLVQEARWRILDSLFQEGRYGEVIEGMDSFLPAASSPEDRLRGYSLLGDAFAALGAPAKAVPAYAQALIPAEGITKAALLSKLEGAVAKIPLPEIAGVLDQVQDSLSVGHLLWRQAELYLEERKWEEARETLEIFRARCPEHPRREEVPRLLATIEHMVAFRPGLLGCLLPLTGPYATFGNRLFQGVEHALREYSETHPDRSVGVIVRDSEGSEEAARNSVQDLVAEGVAAIIGPMVSVEAVVPVVARLGIPCVVFTQKERLSQGGGYVFRNYLTPAMQASALAAYAVDKLGIRTFAILHPQDDYGMAYMNRFWDAVTERGGMVSAVESYTEGRTDFADVIKKLVGLYYERPEVRDADDSLAHNRRGLATGSRHYEKDEAIIDFGALFLPDTVEQVGMILPQLAYHDVTGVVVLGTNLCHSQKLIEMAGAHANGAIFPDLFFDQSPSDRVRGYVESFAGVYGKPPGFLEALGYDTASLLLNTAHLSHVRSREDLRAALAQVSGFDGVTGRTSFDAEGQVHKDLYLLQVVRGRFVQVSPSSRTPPETDAPEQDASSSVHEGPR